MDTTLSCSILSSQKILGGRKGRGWGFLMSLDHRRTMTVRARRDGCSVRRTYSIYPSQEDQFKWNIWEKIIQKSSNNNKKNRWFCKSHGWFSKTLAVFVLLLLLLFCCTTINLWRKHLYLLRTHRMIHGKLIKLQLSQNSNSTNTKNLVSLTTLFLVLLHYYYYDVLFICTFVIYYVIITHVISWLLAGIFRFLI